MAFAYDITINKKKNNSKEANNTAHSSESFVINSENCRLMLPLVVLSYTSCVSVCSCCTIIRLQPPMTMNERGGVSLGFFRINDKRLARVCHFATTSLDHFKILTLHCMRKVYHYSTCYTNLDLICY